MRRFVGLFVVVLVLPALPGRAGTAAPGSTLDKYLDGMSWSLRASTARAEKLSGAIRGAVSPGDAPFLGQVGAYCRGFRAVEGTARRSRMGSILHTVPPSALRRTHSAVATTYADVRAGCVRARAVALAAKRALESLGPEPSAKQFDRARRPAVRELARFDRTKLRAFKQAVRTWRAAVLRHAASRGVAPPDWLRRLRLGP